jgi:hypothetical protein
MELVVRIVSVAVPFASGDVDLRRSDLARAGPLRLRRGGRPLSKGQAGTASASAPEKDDREQSSHQAGTTGHRSPHRRTIVGAEPDEGLVAVSPAARAAGHDATSTSERRDRHAFSVPSQRRGERSAGSYHASAAPRPYPLEVAHCGGGDRATCLGTLHLPYAPGPNAKTSLWPWHN